MDAIRRERLGDPPHAVGWKAEEELEVEEVPTVLVQRAIALPRLAAPERRRLDDVVVGAPHHLRDVELARREVARLPRGLVGVERVPVDEPEVVVALELLDHPRHGARKQRVVGVEVAHVGAARAREAAVQRRDLARVLLPDRCAEPVLVAANDLDAPVRRAVVDDDVLDRLVVLLEHRADRVLQVRGLVVRRRDDRDERVHSFER